MPEKKAYKIYLTIENVELLREYFSTRKGTGGLSEFIDKYVARSATLVTNNKNLFGEIEAGKLTFRKFWKLLKVDFRNA